MTTNKYVNLKNTIFLEISGSDKDDFLQGIITNDIKKCKEKNVIYAAFLTPQGKFLSDFFIINLEKSYLFEIKIELVDQFIEKLNIYKLKSDIKIEKINEKYIPLAIYSRKDIFNELYNPGQLIKIKEGLVFVDPRNSKMGLKAIIKSDKFKNFKNSYNLVEDFSNTYNKKRLINGIPDSLLDLTINKSVLLENNFDLINAIDWDKGCYVGQEITARMKYRSLLKKSLKTIHIVKGKVESGDKIFLDDKIIGDIKSVEENIGLAMIRIDISNTNQKIKTKNGIIKL